MCAKSCLCNSCYKKKTRADCQLINIHKEVNCYTEEIKECCGHIESRVDNFEEIIDKLNSIGNVNPQTPEVIEIAINKVKSTTTYSS